METKEYTTIDRSAAGWPSGEWDSEPDKVQWQDAATGLPCLAVRNQRSGNWCGYVGVAEGHKHFGQSYEEPDVSVHGGLTFANACHAEATPDRGICHIPGKGEPDHVWWFGFDCAHCDDYSPQDKKYEQERGYPFTIHPEERYRTLGYVKAECRSLAAQLAEAK